MEATEHFFPDIPPEKNSHTSRDRVELQCEHSEAKPTASVQRKNILKVKYISNATNPSIIHTHEAQSAVHVQLKRSNINKRAGDRMVGTLQPKYTIYS